MTSRIPRQRRVRHLPDNHLGVTVDDFMNCCAENETPVVYDGETSFLGTETADLEDLGPENAQADLNACGAGRGADCCRYLTVGPEGPCCERFGELRYTLIFKRDMTAQRDPAEPFPQCKIFAA